MTKGSNRKAVAQEVLELAHRKETAEAALETAVNAAAIHDAQIRDVAGYTETRDLLNRLIGKAEMARTFEKFAGVVSLSNLYEIKENKLYQTLKGKSGFDWAGEQIADVGTWAGFCRCLGLSASKVDEDLSNLKALGEEALECLNRVGAGYRHIRQLRKLSPEDQAQVIAEAQATDDKHVLRDLIDELSAKHGKEKDTLESKLSKVNRKLDNERREAEQRKEEIADLQGRIAELTASQLPPDEAEQAALNHLQNLYNLIESIVGSIQLSLLKRELETAPIRVQISTAHLCEYIERVGHALFADVRYQAPNIWAEATPNSNEVHEAREREGAALDKLQASLNLAPLK